MLHVREWWRREEKEDELWYSCTHDDDDDTSREKLRRVRRTGVIIMRNQIFCLLPILLAHN